MKNLKTSIIILFIICANNGYCPSGNNGNSSSKSFFADISPFYACSPERIDIMGNIFPCNTNFGFYVNLSHMVSTNNSQIAQYFTPQGYSYMFAKGGDDYFKTVDISKKKRDIDSQVFNIRDNDFESVFTVLPSSEINYVGLFGYYTFLKNDDCTPKLSIQLAAPIVDIKRKICADESIKKTGPQYENSPIKSILEGLSDSSIQYSRWKFAPEVMTFKGIANVELNLSLNRMPCSLCSVEGYCGIIFPTQELCHNANNNENIFVFYPFGGYGNHFGLQYGTTVNIFLYNNDERNFRLILGTNLIYLFPNTEYRTFDLKNRPWSRYLPAYTNFYIPKEETVQPLANLLTLESRVSPNFTIIATTELDYNQDIYNLCMGYTMYARQAESVTITDAFPNIVLAPANYFLDENKTKISVVREINLRLNEEDIEILDSPYKAGEDGEKYYLSIIRSGDIDKSSAGHPSLLAGTLYGKVYIDLNEYNSLIGIGGSYRFSHNNNAMEYASVWIWGEINF